MTLSCDKMRNDIGNAADDPCDTLWGLYCGVEDFKSWDRATTVISGQLAKMADALGGFKDPKLKQFAVRIAGWKARYVLRPKPPRLGASVVYVASTMKLRDLSREGCKLLSEGGVLLESKGMDKEAYFERLKEWSQSRGSSGLPWWVILIGAAAAAAGGYYVVSRVTP